jgi:UDP-perosamine 4-acetyltransferase
MSNNNNVIVKMPQINPNDNMIYLGEWLIENGAYIHKDTLIAELETSKSIEELLSPSEGYFFRIVESDQLYEVGTEIAVISLDATYMHIPRSIVKNCTTNSEDDNSTILTDKARALVEKLQIPLNLLPKNVLLKEKTVLNILHDQNKNGSSVSFKFPDRFEKAMETSDNDSILIIGAGSTAKLVIETLHSVGIYNIAGIVDMRANDYDTILGIPIIGFNDDATLTKIFNAGITKACNGVINLVDLSVRELLYNRLKRLHFKLPTVIHSKAYVENSAVIEEGVFVHANVYIGAESFIGRNSFLNTSAIVSHDCVIGSTVFLAPNSTIAGFVKIGNRSVIGMGTTVLSRVNIGHDVFIPNGADIVTNIADKTHIYQNPSLRNNRGTSVSDCAKVNIDIQKITNFTPPPLKNRKKNRKYIGYIKVELGLCPQKQAA